MRPRISKSLWRAGFLGLTVLVVGLECLAAFDGKDSTDPWTDLIVAYVPGEVAVLVFGALALWLPVHFAIRYRRKSKQDKEI